MDGVAEEERVVVDDRDLRAQRVRVERAHVGAVDEHAPGGRVVEARDELHERRLARAGGADEGDVRAGLDGQRDVAQGRLGVLAGLVVGERHVAQLDAAGAGRQRLRLGRRGDPRLAVEQLEQARAGGGGALGEAERPAERADRREQHEQVAVEGGELAEREAAVDDLATADEQQRGEPELGQEADERVVEGAQPGGDHRLLEDARHARAEAALLLLLGGERLDDAHAADALLDVGGQLADALLDLLQRRPRAAPVAVGDPDDERDRKQRDGGERRVDDEDRDRGEDDGQRGLRDEHEAVAEEEAHGLQVDGRARHELTGLLAVEEAELLPEQMLVDAVSQVDLDAERDAAGDEPARDGEAEAQHAGDDDEQADELQPVAVAVLDGGDRRAGEAGDRDRRDHRQRGEDRRPPDAALVVAQDAAESDERGHEPPL